MTWAAPASNGGSAISDYTVTSYPSGVTANTSGALTVTVTGLLNGTSYTFTVKAMNAVGTGPASVKSNAVVPVTVPDAPGAPSAIPGNGQATVSWSSPPSYGGSTITGYTVTSNPSGLTANTTGARTATVAGLTNGTSYTFTVTATNAVGTGPASIASNAVVPALPGDCQWALWPIPPVSQGPGNFVLSAGTATDLVTNLGWQRAPGGATTWAGAQTYCAGLASGGLGGWRLPTFIELRSIVNFSKWHPAIDPTVFPATPNDCFWTSTPSALDANNAWAVEFSDGLSNVYYKTNSCQVRCTRCAGAPCAVASAGAGAPAGRYTVSTDTVFDTRTTLTWQRDAPATTQYWANAETYCLGLNLGGTGWRLPTVKELESLLDVRAAVAPTIDSVAFPNTPGGYFWSSSPQAYYPDRAWAVSFSTLSTYPFSLALHSQRVRCVR